MLFICRGGGVALLIGRCWSDSWEFDVNSTGSGIITLIYSLSVENCGCTTQMLVFCLQKSMEWLNKIAQVDPRTAWERTQLMTHLSVTMMSPLVLTTATLLG